ncbi:MAG: hypothetical protein JW913_00815 [Chitinispirillaceae bacterium]|nr:hypothetical protein [Chitinispirillaceae bacterium]
MAETRKTVPLLSEIHDQLEFLKYIGGKDGKGVPTGEGYPVNIVSLPDLILDIRRYNVIPNNRERICAIGGRSARTACILAHLCDGFDGIYTPYLITKTGNLGKYLLENEFYYGGDSCDTFNRRKLKRFIVERNGEPRCTIWNHPCGNNFTTRDSGTEFELSVDDIRNNMDIKRIFDTATVIYFSSIKTPNFREVFDYLIDEQSFPQAAGRNGKNIFFDCTRAQPKHVEAFKKMLNEKRNVRNRIAGLFVSSEEDEIFKSQIASDYLGYFKELGMLFLYYFPQRVQFYDFEGILQADQSVQSKLDNEDIPERFKAGFLLAYSVRLAMETISASFSRPDKDFFEEAAQTMQRFWEIDPWGKIIDYGLAFASASDNEFKVCTLKNLLPDEDDRHFPKGVLTPDVSLTDMASERPKHIRIGQPDLAKLARAAGYRRMNGLKINKKIYSHERCKNKNKCRYFAQFPDKCKEDYLHHYAVMLDLDGTLMNSTLERQRGLECALNWLHGTAGILDPVPDGFVPVDFFERHVYEGNQFYYELGLGDFRQKWNHSGWYAAYITLYSDMTLAGEIRNDLDTLKAFAEHNKKDKKRIAEKVKRIIKDAQWSDSFKNLYQDNLEKHSDLIAELRRKFLSIEMFAFKEAYDFVKSLKDTGIYDFYIVSEGDPETQWMKIEAIGLSEFIPRDRVLTTGDAAEPIKEKETLAKERDLVKNEIAEIEKKIEGNGETVNTFSKFEQHIQAKLINTGSILTDIKERLRKEIYDLFSENLSRFTVDLAFFQRELEEYEARQKVLNFMESVLERVSCKGGVTFYASVLRAILDEPKTPLVALRKFSKLIDMSPADRPYKFAMIGDRQDNDIAPPIKLLKPEGILTFRMISPKFSAGDAASVYTPSYVAETLAQVKAILLSESAWKDTHCVYDPPFFCLKIDFDDRDFLPSSDEMKNPDEVDLRIGLNVILGGLRMFEGRFALTNKVCEKILYEHIRENPKQDLQPILASVYEIPKNYDTGFVKEVRRSSRVLTTLVSDSMLKFDCIKNVASHIFKILKGYGEFLTKGRGEWPEIKVVRNAMELLERAGYK